MPTQEQFDLLEQPIDSLLNEQNSYEDPDSIASELFATRSGINASNIVDVEAAKIALLEGEADKAVNTYGQITHEYRTEGRSPTADGILNSVKEAEKTKDIDVLTDIMADPYIPDEVKVEASKAWDAGVGDRYNVNNLFAAKYGAAFDPQTEEQEAEHDVLLDKLDENIKVRQEIGKMWNEFSANADLDVAKNLAEVSVSTIMPFVSGIKATEVRNALVDDDPSTIMNILSSGMESLPRTVTSNMLQTMPVSDLMAAHKRVKDALENSGLDFGSHNILAFQEAARVQNGEYSSTDAIVDSLFSLIDIAYIGARTAMGVSRVASGISDESAAMRRARGDLEVAGRRQAHNSKLLEALKNRIRPTVDQGSAGQIAADTNLEKWRAMVKAIADDPTDQTAMALYGRTRDEALAHTDLPRIAADDGTVERIPTFESPEIKQFAENAERHFRQTLDSPLTDAEKAQAIEKTKQRISNIRTLQSNPAMTSVKVVDDQTFVQGVYTPANGGVFTDGEEAIRQVKEATRHWGLDDSAYELLTLDGTHFVRRATRSINTSRKGGGKRARDAKQLKYQDVEFENVQVGNPTYAVRVNFPETFSVKDVERFDKLKPTKNWLDRIWVGKQNTITRMFLNPSSILDPFESSRASVAALKTSLIEQEMTKMFNVVTLGMLKLPAQRQIAVVQRLERANFEEIDINPTMLAAEGFDLGEIKVMMQFKQSNNEMWKLTNMDTAYSERAKGNKLFVHEGLGTSLPAKPVSKADDTHVYDPETDTIKLVTADEIARAKVNGGGIIKVEGELRSGDESTQYLFNPNSSDIYLREISITDKLIPYKAGYYHVKYGDPHFIAKRVKTKDGETILRRVGTAPDTIAAKKTLDAFRREDPDAEFEIVPEMRTKEMGLDYMTDSGMLGRLSFQKGRGQRLLSLDESGGLSAKSTHILNPIDATIQSVKSLSNRMGMRTTIETMKQRWLQEYGHLSDTEWGGKRRIFPVSSDRIAYRDVGKYSDKDIADAKTSWNYIKTIEDGFVNGIDDALKSSITYLARAIGGKGLEKYLRSGGTNSFASLMNVEKMLRWASENASPLETMRMIASVLGLVMHPLRQALIQLSAFTNAFALHPFGIHRSIGAGLALFGRFAEESKGVQEALGKIGIKDAKIHSPGAKIAGLSDNQIEEMFKHFQDSGLVSSVHTHNMLSSMMHHFADQSSTWNNVGGGVVRAGRKVSRSTKKGVGVAKNVGFDAGEIGAKMFLFAAEYAHQLKKTGKQTLTKKEVEDVIGTVSELTSNMDRAGEMPWNQNSISFFMQFTAATYKQVMMFTTSRRFSPTEKARIAAGFAVMWGIPIGMVDGWLAENDMPELVGEASRGLNDMIANLILDGIFDDDSQLAIQETFSPVGSQVRDLADGKGIGVTKLMLALWEDPQQTFNSTPVGRLFLGEEPKFAEAARRLAAFTGVWEDPYKRNIEAQAVVKGFADLTAGTSAAFKTYLGMQLGYKVDAEGQPFIPASARNMWAEVFSIPTEAEVLERLRTGKEVERYKAREDDLKKFADNWMKAIVANGDNPASVRQQNQYNAAALDIFGDDYFQARKAMMTYNFKGSQIGKDFFNIAHRQSGLPDSNSLNAAAFLARAKAIDEAKPGTAEKAQEAINILERIKGEMK